MNAYAEMKKKHQEEVNAFPMVFAFGKEQFAEAMKKLGLKTKDTDKVCTIYGAGDIMRKSDVPAYREMTLRHRKEFEDAVAADKTGDGFIYDMFDYELANHEYGYTRNPSDALAALGVSRKAIEKDPRLARGFRKACKHQEDWFDENNGGGYRRGKRQDYGFYGRPAGQLRRSVPLPRNGKGVYPAGV